MSSREPLRLDRIALSLSGGGYRAAAFHLGVLTFLDRVGLLQNVRAISTASGGSITAAFYVQSLARRESFDSFAKRCYEFLRDVDVIDAALQHGGKLITAAANVYAKVIDATLGEIQRSNNHIDELSINATDFTHGIAFRFVKSQSTRVRSGNNYTRVDPFDAERIRLADAVAASSCFPGAFEPITFPEDFVILSREDGEGPAGESDTGPSASTRLRMTGGTPLMDGGIFD